MKTDPETFIRANTSLLAPPHAREDYTSGPFAGRDDVNWRKHTLAWVNEAGDVKLDYRPVHTDLIADGIDPHKIEPKARVY